MSSSVGQNHAFSCQQLVMRYCHGRLEFGRKITCSVSVIAIQWIYNPVIFFQGMTNNVGLTLSVGDTIPRLTISIEQYNWNW